uniref:Uncharacterized protein n=1 Tax=Thermosporothrix sp. COM3 TaxID=2490863 RepID=A0A455SKT6_9CHLR|nr:hypothetical protein KTC_23200 [Thermosporothrix sp. COM3]
MCEANKIVEAGGSELERVKVPGSGQGLTVRRLSDTMQKLLLLHGIGQVVSDRPVDYKKALKSLSNPLYR